MTTTSEHPEYLSIADAARRMPGRMAVATVWRWTAEGYHGVRLRTTRVGRRIWTTPAWVDEFLTAIEQVNDPAAPRTAPPRTTPAKPRMSVRKRLQIRK